MHAAFSHWLPAEGAVDHAYLHALGPDELMGAGVPQADVSVVATGEEVRLPWVGGQAPHLVRVTLERSTVSPTSRLLSPDHISYFTLRISYYFSVFGVILVCLYLCNRDKLSIQTALQDKVLGGPNKYRLSSAFRYGPDGTKQLRHLQITPAQPPQQKLTIIFHMPVLILACGGSNECSLISDSH